MHTRGTGISWRFISQQILVVAIMKQSSEDAKIKLVQFHFEAKSVILTQREFRIFRGPENTILKLYSEYWSQFSGSGEYIQ